MLGDRKQVQVWFRIAPTRTLVSRDFRGGGVGYVGKLRQENTPHSLLSLHRTQLGRWDDVYDGVSALSLLLHVGFLSTSDRSLGGH